MKKTILTILVLIMFASNALAASCPAKYSPIGPLSVAGSLTGFTASTDPAVPSLSITTADLTVAASAITLTYTDITPPYCTDTGYSASDLITLNQQYFSTISDKPDFSKVLSDDTYIYDVVGYDDLDTLQVAQMSATTGNLVNAYTIKRQDAGIMDVRGAALLSDGDLAITYINAAGVYTIEVISTVTWTKVIARQVSYPSAVTPGDIVITNDGIADLAVVFTYYGAAAGYATIKLSDGSKVTGAKDTVYTTVDEPNKNNIITNGPDFGTRVIFTPVSTTGKLLLFDITATTLGTVINNQNALVSVGATFQQAYNTVWVYDTVTYTTVITTLIQVVGIDRPAIISVQSDGTFNFGKYSAITFFEPPIAYAGSDQDLIVAIPTSLDSSLYVIDAMAGTQLASGKVNNFVVNGVATGIMGGYIYRAATGEYNNNVATLLTDSNLNPNTFTATSIAGTAGRDMLYSNEKFTALYEGSFGIQIYGLNANPDVPEFSIPTLLLATLLAGGLVLFVVRRRK